MCSEEAGAQEVPDFELLGQIEFSDSDDDQVIREMKAVQPGVMHLLHQFNECDLDVE